MQFLNINESSPIVRDQPNFRRAKSTNSVSESQTKIKQRLYLMARALKIHVCSEAKYKWKQICVVDS